VPEKSSSEPAAVAVAERTAYVVGMKSRIRVGQDADGNDALVPVVIPNVLQLPQQGIQLRYAEEEGQEPIDLGTVDQFYANLRDDFREIVELPEFSFAKDLPAPLQPIGGIRTTVHDLRLASGEFNDGRTALRVRVKFTPEAGKVHLPGLKQIYLKDCDLMVQLGAFADEPADAEWWADPAAAEAKKLPAGEQKALPAPDDAEVDS
jgi:hypothetical protein